MCAGESIFTTETRDGICSRRMSALTFPISEFAGLIMSFWRIAPFTAAALSRVALIVVLALVVTGCSARTLIPDVSGNGHLPTQWEPEESEGSK